LIQPIADHPDRMSSKISHTHIRGREYQVAPQQPPPVPVLISVLAKYSYPEETLAISPFNCKML
jgi:hypothetical protein